MDTGRQFATNALNTYLTLSLAHNEENMHEFERFSSEACDNLNWDNNLTEKHLIKCDVFHLLNTRSAANSIINECSNRGFSWESVSRTLELHRERKRSTLQLLRHVAESPSIMDGMFLHCNEMWEARVISNIIDMTECRRVRSRVQAEIYTRSAKANHRIKGHEYLAKNDNRTHSLHRLSA